MCALEEVPDTMTVEVIQQGCKFAAQIRVYSAGSYTRCDRSMSLNSLLRQLDSNRNLGQSPKQTNKKAVQLGAHNQAARALGFSFLKFLFETKEEFEKQLATSWGEEVKHPTGYA